MAYVSVPTDDTKMMVKESDHRKWRANEKVEWSRRKRTSPALSLLLSCYIRIGVLNHTGGYNSLFLIKGGLDSLPAIRHVNVGLYFWAI